MMKLVEFLTPSTFLYQLPQTLKRLRVELNDLASLDLTALLAVYAKLFKLIEGKQRKVFADFLFESLLFVNVHCFTNPFLCLRRETKSFLNPGSTFDIFSIHFSAA